jgi:hypothetical protein
MLPRQANGRSYKSTALKHLGERFKFVALVGLAHVWIQLSLQLCSRGMARTPGGRDVRWNDASRDRWGLGDGPETRPGASLGIDPSSAAGGSWGGLPGRACHQPMPTIFVPALFNHRARPVSIQKEGSRSGQIRDGGAVASTKLVVFRG